MTELADQLCEQYLQRLDIHQYAYTQDGTYHAAFHHMRHCLHQADTAMGQVGIPARERRLILATLLDGPPDAQAATNRIKDHEAAVAESMRRPARPIILAGPL